MAIKCGIKLWSTNTDLFPIAVSLVREHKIDCVEVYTVPGKVDLGSLEIFRGVEMFVHAPHENHSFNVSDLDAATVEMFQRDVIQTTDFLKAEHIVVHAGVETDNNKFQKKYEQIRDPRILIENMPLHGIHNEICYGYSFDQLQFIRNEIAPLCIDIGHAIKSALARKIDYKEFLTSLKSLDPFYFHICDGDIKTSIDEHLNLGQGNFDLRWMKQYLLDLSKDETIYLVFEVPKNQRDLANDLANIERFKFIKI